MRSKCSTCQRTIALTSYFRLGSPDTPSSEKEQNFCKFFARKVIKTVCLFQIVPLTLIFLSPSLYQLRSSPASLSQASLPLPFFFFSGFQLLSPSVSSNVYYLSSAPRSPTVLGWSSKASVSKKDGTVNGPQPLRLFMRALGLNQQWQNSTLRCCPPSYPPASSHILYSSPWMDRESTSKASVSSRWRASLVLTWISSDLCGLLAPSLPSHYLFLQLVSRLMLICVLLLHFPSFLLPWFDLLSFTLVYCFTAAIFGQGLVALTPPGERLTSCLYTGGANVQSGAIFFLLTCLLLHYLIYLLVLCNYSATFFYLQ